MWPWQLVVIGIHGQFGARENIPHPLTDTSQCEGIIYINPKAFKKRGVNAKMQASKLDCRQTKHIYSPVRPDFGQFACTTGHIMALQWLATSSLAYAIIMEDDVQFALDDNKLADLVSAKSMLPRLKHHPVIKLYWDNQQEGGNKVLRGNQIFNDVCHANGAMTSSIAYVVRRSYATFLFRYMQYAMPNSVANYNDKRFPQWMFENDSMVSHLQIIHGHGAWCPVDGHAVSYVQRGPLSAHSTNTISTARANITGDVQYTTDDLT